MQLVIIVYHFILQLRGDEQGGKRYCFRCQLENFCSKESPLAKELSSYCKDPQKFGELIHKSMAIENYTEGSGELTDEDDEEESIPLKKSKMVSISKDLSDEITSKNVGKCKQLPQSPCSHILYTHACALNTIQNKQLLGPNHLDQ